MAIIGTDVKDVSHAIFVSGDNDWGSFASNAYQIYVGFGYQEPSDITWVNKPTGTTVGGGAVMAFPRSAEATTVIVPSGSGRGWKLKEC